MSQIGFKIGRGYDARLRSFPMTAVKLDVEFAAVEAGNRDLR